MRNNGIQNELFSKNIESHAKFESKNILNTETKIFEEDNYDKSQNGALFQKAVGKLSTLIREYTSGSMAPPIKISTTKNPHFQCRISQENPRSRTFFPMCYVSIIIVVLIICSQKSLVNGGNYKHLNYDELILNAKHMAKIHPDIFEYSDAYERYKGLIPESLGDGRLMEFPIIKATNFKRSKDQIKKLPQVLFLGPLHGDEIIGANVLSYFLKWIAEGKNNKFLDILNTRVLIMLIVSNPQGYCMKNRFSNGIDANRDFPYDTDKTKGMITPTARVINEIVREHLIVSSIVFHGGDNSISYPWGNFVRGNKSPDNVAFSQVAQVLKEEAGGFSPFTINEYKIGTMTETVYAVKGGMEDWIYSGSWDLGPNVQGEPSNKPYYSPDRTMYGSDTVRVFIYLVEGGESKSPNELTYGDDDLWDNKGNISRNLLITNTMAKLASPEIMIISTAYSETENSLTIEYKVLGCLAIDSIQVKYSDLGNKQDAFRYMNITGPYFSGKIGKFSIKDLKSTKNFFLNIDLKGDSGWADKETPQTHMVRLRTSEKYKVENNGYSLDYTKGFYKNISLAEAKIGTYFTSFNQTTDFGIQKGAIYPILPMHHLMQSEIMSGKQLSGVIVFHHQEGRDCEYENESSSYYYFNIVITSSNGSNLDLPIVNQEQFRVQVMIYEPLERHNFDRYEIHKEHAYLEKDISGKTNKITVSCKLSRGHLLDIIGKEISISEETTETSFKNFYTGLITPPEESQNFDYGIYAGELEVSQKEKYKFLFSSQSNGSEVRIMVPEKSSNILMNQNDKVVISDDQGTAVFNHVIDEEDSKRGYLNDIVEYTKFRYGMDLNVGINDRCQWKITLFKTNLNKFWENVKGPSRFSQNWSNINSIREKNDQDSSRLRKVIFFILIGIVVGTVAFILQKLYFDRINKPIQDNAKDFSNDKSNKNQKFEKNRITHFQRHPRETFEDTDIMRNQFETEAQDENNQLFDY